MGSRVVGAGDDRSASCLDSVAEFDEGFAHLLRGPVVVEVVGFDVGEDADRRFVEEERSVGFVRFGDEHVAGAQVGVRARRRQHSPDDEGRIDSAGLQRHGGHRRGRGLPMRTGHGYGPPVDHERGESSGAVQDTQSPTLGFDELGVVLADGRGDDEGIGLTEVVRRMPDHDCGAQGPQHVDDVGFLRIRSGDFDSVHDHDPSDSGHSRTADPDEVDGSEFADGNDVRGARVRRGHVQPSSARLTMAAMRAAASVG